MRPAEYAPLALPALLWLGGAAALASDWPSYGNDPGGSQYSPLAQLDRDHVRRLRPAWQHRSGDLVDKPGLEGTSYEVTPIVVDGRLYYCTPLNKVIALDPATVLFAAFLIFALSGPIRALFRGKAKAA